MVLICLSGWQAQMDAVHNVYCFSSARRSALTRQCSLNVLPTPLFCLRSVNKLFVKFLFFRPAPMPSVGGLSVRFGAMAALAQCSAKPLNRPLDEVTKVAPGTRISILAGTRDDHTLPRFSERYVADLQSSAVRTRLTYAASSTHVSVLRSPEFFMLGQRLAQDLSR